MTGFDDRASGIAPPASVRVRSALAALLSLAILLCLSGCGTAVTTNQDFRERIIGVDGQEIWIEDIQEINDDDDLDEDAKRQAYRDLGIVDPDLIDALLIV